MRQVHDTTCDARRPVVVCAADSVKTNGRYIEIAARHMVSKAEVVEVMPE